MKYMYNYAIQRKKKKRIGKKKAEREKYIDFSLRNFEFVLRYKSGFAIKSKDERKKEKII